MISRAERETLDFLNAHLAGRRRVLDVGCGRGEYAAALAARGHEVVGIDLKLRDELPRAEGLRFEQIDFLQFNERPFDAVIFVTSLHHVFALEDAVRHARELLVRGGLVIAEEFALEAPDEATARWYYDHQERLIAAGQYPADRLRAPRDLPPVRRWQREHEHQHADGHHHAGEHHHADPGRRRHEGRHEEGHAGAHEGERLSFASEMRAAIAREFDLVFEENGAFLYRYIEAGVRAAAPDGAQEVGSALANEEKRLIALGTLKPVGVRYVGRRI